MEEAAELGNYLPLFFKTRSEQEGPTGRWFRVNLLLRVTGDRGALLKF